MIDSIGVQGQDVDRGGVKGKMSSEIEGLVLTKPLICISFRNNGVSVYMFPAF